MFTNSNTTPIHPVAARVTALYFKDFVTDPDALIAAIHGGDIHEANQYLTFSPRNPARIAAEKAKSCYANDEDIRMAASLGFWEENLEKLLAIAEANPLHGAKLAQVFLFFLDRADQYRLSSLLTARLLCYVDKRAQEDGCLITKQERGTIHEILYPMGGGYLGI